MKFLALLALAVVAHAFEIPRFNALDIALDNQRSTRNVRSCEVYTYSCVAAGGTCNTLTGNDYTICDEGDCGDDGKCPSVPSLGQTCNTTCSFGLVCSPATKVCVTEASISQPGTACTKDEECTFTNSTGTYAICGANGLCHGVPLGGACTKVRSECAGFAFCKKGKCAPSVPQGGTCYTSDACRPADVCSRNKCVRSGSVKQGKPCTEDSACADGLTCNDHSKKCTTKTFSGKCSVDSDCTASKMCECDNVRNYTTCYSDHVNVGGALLASFGDCVYKNNCGSFLCAREKCASTYCPYRNLTISTFYAPGQSCLIDYYLSQIENFLPPCEQK